MIDKPPRSSKPVPGLGGLDDSDLDDAVVRPAAGAETPDEVEAQDDGLPPDEDSELGLSAADILAAQKRRGNMVLVIGGTICAVVLIAFGYPRFKHYFVTDQPPEQTAVTTPVPMTARKNYFAGDDKNAPPNAGGDTSGDLSPPAAAGAGEANNAIADNGTVPAVPGVAPSPPAAPQEAPVGNPPVPAASSPGAASSAASLPPSVTAGAQSPSGSTPVTPLPAGQPETLPAPAAITQSAPASDDQVKALKDSVDKLTATHDADQKQLQALQASLAMLQQQLAQVKAASAPAQASSSSHQPHARLAARQRAPEANAWVLRSATNDMALIGHPGKDDLKKIVPGDVVTGLGKIKSIEEQNGLWVVHGTGGSLEQ
jgi:hypothetical protein